MVKLSVEQIVAATRTTAPPWNPRVAGSAVDDSARSRRPLFVAFAGEKVNGNSYLPSAAQANAAVVVASEPA